jgi:hypothetical protein
MTRRTRTGEIDVGDGFLKVQRNSLGLGLHWREEERRGEERRGAGNKGKGGKRVKEAARGRDPSQPKRVMAGE